MEKVFLKEASRCNGCSACANVCPKNCITMTADKLGFLYPEIDNGLCVNCGLCESVCPVFGGTKAENFTRAFAVKNKNADVVALSSSGGAFTAVAEEIIKNGGVVFGAAFKKDFTGVEHIAVEKAEDLSLLRGSKYVQSKIGDAYFKAKTFLDRGRQVLFTGTPCQIEGLLSYLKKPYDKLYTQDIICHGVPAPAVWEKYVQLKKEQYNSEIKGASFRCKKSGWSTFSMQILFENGKQYCVKKSQDLYMKGFLDNLYLRSSCYDCAFKTVSRKADITLADFWGVWNIHPDFHSDKGVSLVLCHSEKGATLIEGLSDKLEIIETDTESAVQFNSAATHSVPSHPQREDFINDFEKLPFEVTMKKYCTPAKENLLKSKIKSVVKRLIK